MCLSRLAPAARILVCLVLAALPWGPVPSVQAGPESRAASGSFRRFLHSDAGLFILRETPQGRDLTRRLIGREISGEADLREVTSRLSWRDPESEALRWQIELRFQDIERELRALGLIEGAAASARARSLALEELAARYLALDAGALARGEIAFARVPPGTGGLSGRVAEFLRTEETAAAAADRGARYEPLFPARPGSIEARLPEGRKVHARLAELERRYLGEAALADAPRIVEILSRSQGGREPSVRQVLDYVTRRRQALGGDLAALAREYEALDPALSATLRRAVGEIRMSAAARRRYLEKLDEIGDATFDVARHADEVRGYSSKIPGELGELRVAVLESGYLERSASIEGLFRHLGRGEASAAARAELARLVEAEPGLFRKEHDLFLERGSVWGEVKNYGDPVDNAHGYWPHVLEQAKKMLEAKRLIDASPALRLRLGGPIRLRMYFIGGISEPAARELEMMGFQVFGRGAGGSRVTPERFLEAG